MASSTSDCRRCTKLLSFFKGVVNKLDPEQYRQVLAPKFPTGADGEEYARNVSMTLRHHSS